MAQSILHPKKLVLAGVISTIISGHSVSVNAQEEMSEDELFASLETIVVTAQRREQNLQDVPFAVSAFSEEAIEKSDISDFFGIQGQVPNMVISGDERMSINMRGIGVDNLSAISAEAAVPVNIDGVYMSRNTIGESEFADLQQIEVLRGPQGTLYGRNATAGTVNLWTKTPDGETTGDFALQVGNYDQMRFRGAVGFPIIGDELSARISIASRENDGYRRDISRNVDVDDRDHKSGKAVIHWEPSDEFELTLRASAARNENGGPVSQYVSGLPGTPGNPVTTGGFFGLTPEQVAPSDPKEVAHDQDSEVNVDVDVYSATMSWDLGPTVLKSVTAFQEHASSRTDDNEGSGLGWIGGNLEDKSEALTQEITISSNTDGAVDWVAGVWYYDDDARGDAFFDLNFLLLTPEPPPAAPRLGFTLEQETEAWAAFGQATWSVTDRLRLTGGLRFSAEEKKAVQNAPHLGAACDNLEVEDDWSILTPKAAVDFDISDNVMMYGSAAKGFKAGGINLANCGNTYDEEQLWAYEFGFKTDWFDNRLRFNVNGFYYDYTDLQLTRVLDFSLAVDNIGEAENTGLEVELVAQATQNLLVSAGFSWQDAEIKEYTGPRGIPREGDPAEGIDNSGNQLPNAPDMTLNLAAEFNHMVGENGSLTYRVEHNWVDERYFSAFNEEFEFQDAVGRTNARLIYARDGGSMAGLELHLFINNIEDEDVLLRSTASIPVGGFFQVYEDPQTYGMELRYGF